MSIIKDASLADAGKKRIEWIGERMPVLRKIRERYEKEKPLEGVKITACLHVTSETANLMLTLLAGGAEISLTAANPLSTQDDVAAALAERMKVFAFRGETEKEYYDCLAKALELRPNIILDDGGDAITAVHTSLESFVTNVKGACEETTTGVIRERALAAEGRLKFPIIAINDAETKMMFDNRYGTGQSTLHGIMNATNILFAGRTVVVAGYGWCGRGVAMRARGMGANVIVVETNPRKALEAAMDGYRVMPMRKAAEIGDLFITVTGDISVIRGEHFRLMKNGAILANAGHFNVEIDLKELEELAVEKKDISENVTEYVLEDRRKLYLLSQGRIVNLAAAYGHPPEVMDMSFANQALCARFLVENHEKLERYVYSVPKEIDEEVARLKLETMGIEIEELTEEQQKYLGSWSLGTQ
ncbi:MAG: S-adenosylhomocysteine hydrolase [Candidatus Alkanophagales archaeon MCA70_species_2]|nr:S-adenosylhomocysteine hydrolase [Candidatus Alkanophaga liquidiphilum]RLG37174.1 MAG: adenosylhomocysteinase [Candidatus Alkanophagales archaeon]